MDSGVPVRNPFLDLEIYRLIAVLDSSPVLAEFEGSYETDRNKGEVLRGLEFPEISRIMVSLAAKIEDLVALQYKRRAIEESDNLTEQVLKKIEDLIQNVTEGTRRTRGACDSRTEAPRRGSGGLRTPTAPVI